MLETCDSLIDIKLVVLLETHFADGKNIWRISLSLSSSHIDYFKKMNDSASVSFTQTNYDKTLMDPFNNKTFVYPRRRKRQRAPTLNE